MQHDSHQEQPVGIADFGVRPIGDSLQVFDFLIDVFDAINLVERFAGACGLRINL